MRRDPPPTLFAKSNGIELAYDSFGDPAAQPLLLIMGLGTQMIAWDEVFCEQLAARGYRVIRFDNRDIGLSSSQDHLPSPEAQADANICLLDALGIGSAHIVGASMGGAIGQELALRYPMRVRTLVSIMSTSGAPGLPPPKPEALQVLLTPAPTDRAGYIERQQRVMKILRAGAYPDEEALDAARAERAACLAHAW